MVATFLINVMQPRTCLQPATQPYWAAFRQHQATLMAGCCRMQALYQVLSKADIQRRQQEAVKGVTSILGIAEEEAVRVLRTFKW